MLYCDLILHSLPEAALRALKAMDLDNYEFQSDFARKYYGRGMKMGTARGRIEGRIEIILKMLARRYGALSEAIEARVRSLNSTELDEIAEQLLTAETLEEALGMVEA
jgi:predicted transposase YdaD